MDTTKFVNIILALAVVLLSVKIILFPDGNHEHEPVDTAQAVIDNIMTRTSIRAYTDQPVSGEDVETLLKAAMAAPSARNQQPWAFVVINDQAVKDSISANISTSKMVAGAPLVIAICGNLDKALSGTAQPYWIQDASAATENMLLAAHALGLGAVWCGIYPVSAREDYIRELVNLPPNLVPFNLVAIGYPAEEPAPKDKWKPENIIYLN